MPFARSDRSLIAARARTGSQSRGKPLLAAALIALLVALPAVEVGATAQCEAVLASDLQKVLALRSLPAAQFSLQTRDGPPVDLAFGEASPGHALTTDHALRIASLSKILTGLAMLDADADGSLPLDSKLVEVLGLDHASLGRGTGDIRLRNLLAHRSGLRRQEGLDEMLRPEPRCPADVGQILSGALQSPPGAFFQYSNVGYCLLGEALRVHTGRPLAETIDASLARRIGPSSLAPHDARDRTVRYHASPDDPGDDPASYRFNYPAMLASGGFQGSARDLARLVALAFPARTLKTLDTAPPACRRDTGVRNCHGLVFHVFDDAQGQRMFWRDGSLPGVSALAVVPAHARWNWVFVATRRHRDGLRLNEQLLAAIGQAVARHVRCEEAQNIRRDRE